MAALHERLVFDTDRGQVLDATRRYVLLRSDVLMGLFDALPGAAREVALRAFGRSVAEHGTDSVRTYAATVGVEALPAAMEQAAASLGWGRWQLRPSAPGAAARSLHLAVENSPFAAASTRPVTPACHAIAGMLEAIAGALWSGAAEAHETHCAAQHGGTACEFVATPSHHRRPTT